MPITWAKAVKNVETKCTCGGKEDGWHISTCDRRKALDLAWRQAKAVEDAKWEYVGNDTSRYRVDGGWLIRANESSGSYEGGVAVSIIFVSDDKIGEWK
jgi:hypothetical protein